MFEEIFLLKELDNFVWEWNINWIEEFSFKNDKRYNVKKQNINVENENNSINEVDWDDFTVEIMELME